MTTEHYTGVEVSIGQMAEKWGCKTTKDDRTLDRVRVSKLWALHAEKRSVLSR